MKILIVEDDGFKMKAIQNLLHLIVEDLSLEMATSLRSAMTCLEHNMFDFVVLDMAIPSHTSDMGAVDTYSQPVGGLDVLLFLASNARPERVAVLTQYPTVEYDRKHVPLRELVSVLHADGVDNIVNVVQFSDGDTWQGELSDAIGGVS
jgi:DNA-binding NtrC family response regulator